MSIWGMRRIPPYVIRCQVCQQSFRRRWCRTTRIRSHRRPDGAKCQGREGYWIAWLDGAVSVDRSSNKCSNQADTDRFQTDQSDLMTCANDLR